MAEGFVGEVRLFAGKYAPLYWLYCHGQILEISEYDVLFSVIGTTYGGNGGNTFQLPDLRGRANFSSGAAPGLINKRRGDFAGNDFTILSFDELPPHAHPIENATTSHALTANGLSQFKCQNTHGNSNSPEGKTHAAANDRGGDMIYGDDNDKLMKLNSVELKTPLTGQITVSGHTSSVGNGRGFSNLPPFSVADYIICYNGVYPQRS